MWRFLTLKDLEGQTFYAPSSHCLLWLPHRSCQVCTPHYPNETLAWDASSLARHRLPHKVSVVLCCARGSTGGGGGVLPFKKSKKKKLAWHWESECADQLRLWLFILMFASAWLAVWALRRICRGQRCGGQMERRDWLRPFSPALLLHPAPPPHHPPMWGWICHSPMRAWWSRSAIVLRSDHWLQICYCGWWWGRPDDHESLITYHSCIAKAYWTKSGSSIINKDIYCFWRKTNILQYAGDEKHTSIPIKNRKWGEIWSKKATLEVQLSVS